LQGYRPDRYSCSESALMTQQQQHVLLLSTCNRNDLFPHTSKHQLRACSNCYGKSEEVAKARLRVISPTIFSKPPPLSIASTDCGRVLCHVAQETLGKSAAMKRRIMCLIYVIMRRKVLLKLNTTARVSGSFRGIAGIDVQVKCRDDVTSAVDVHRFVNSKLWPPQG
jgi:hypothetical protein